MHTDIACCRQCGGHNVVLFPVGVTDPNYDDPAASRHPAYTYAYYCRGCGHTTPERPTAALAAGDVDWCPAADVMVR